MERLILRGAHLFDGTGRAPHGNLAVVVENGRTADVLPEGALGRELDGRSVDLSGCVLLPLSLIHI